MFPKLLFFSDQEPKPWKDSFSLIAWTSPLTQVVTSPKLVTLLPEKAEMV